MQEANPYVDIINYSLETDAECGAVAMQGMELPLLVYSTHLYGIKLSKSITKQVLLAFDVFYSDQLKDSLGNNQKIEDSSLMMLKMLKRLKLYIFSFLNASIVLKPSALLVVLLLLGPSLIGLRVPPKFFSFLNKPILPNHLVLTISASIKPANFYALSLQLTLGMIGKQPAALLWTHIITPITKQQMISVVLGAILHHHLRLILTLWVPGLIKMAFHDFIENSILRQQNNSTHGLQDMHQF